MRERGKLQYSITLLRSTKLVVIIINYGGLGALGKQDLCHEGAAVNR